MIGDSELDEWQVDVDRRGGHAYVCVERNGRGAEAEGGGLLFLENQLVVWVEQTMSHCGCGLGKEEPFREK